MKIEVDKKRAGIIAVVAALFFALGLAINQGNDSDEMDGMHSHSSSSSDFSADDIMFAQMMIPHHQQAVVMSDLALKNSTNPELLALAKKIKSAQAPEIEQMKSWLAKAGTSLMGNHGMSMDGMLSENEIDQLAKSSGIEFDLLFLAGMIGHHEGALTMVSMLDTTKNGEAKQLAENIRVSQTAEIAAMKKLLEEIK
jgi:uncharacterized protein (DUF305 family)